MLRIQKSKINGLIVAFQMFIFASVLSLKSYGVCTALAAGTACGVGHSCFQVPTGGVCYSLTGVNGVCQEVTNAGSKQLMIPNDTAAEWQSFVSNASISGVTKGSCCSMVPSTYIYGAGANVAGNLYTVSTGVPVGCTKMEVHAWGGGGGSGTDSSNNVFSGAGGAGGYVTGVFSITTGQVIMARAGVRGNGGLGTSGGAGGALVSSSGGTTTNYCTASTYCSGGAGGSSGGTGSIGSGTVPIAATVVAAGSAGAGASGGNAGGSGANGGGGGGGTTTGGGPAGGGGGGSASYVLIGTSEILIAGGGGGGGGNKTNGNGAGGAGGSGCGGAGVAGSNAAGGGGGGACHFVAAGTTGGAATAGTGSSPATVSIGGTTYPTFYGNAVGGATVTNAPGIDGTHGLVIIKFY